MAVTTLYADTETYSEVPIGFGTYRYAEAAEVMLFAWALDDGPVSVWDLTTGASMPPVLAAAWEDPNTKVVFHNAAFDRTVMSTSLLWAYSVPPLERWHCTMVQAMAHSLPGGLDKLGDIFGLGEDEQKRKTGKDLINLFCKPRPKNMKLRRATRETHPQKWAEFVEYAAFDIHAMRALHRDKLPAWNLTEREVELWRLDQKINARGFAVDHELAVGALRAVGRAKATLAARTSELTEGEVQAATQRDALLAHILEQHGVDLPDMQASTLERRLEDENLPAVVRELIGIRLQASGTNVKKFKRVLDACSSDGRLRGTLQFCGAKRTGRWAGRVFQPQNLSRPSLKWEDIARGIEAMKLGVEDLLYV